MHLTRLGRFDVCVIMISAWKTSLNLIIHDYYNTAFVHDMWPRVYCFSKENSHKGR